jgi:iron complex transport system ATP-binding protein
MHHTENKTRSSVALEASNLAVGYRHGRENLCVAKNIRFSLRKGELAAIVGINGIGKSTLLRTLARVQPALSGEITVNGTNLSQLNEQVLAETISVVLTEPIATRNLSVVELVSLGRQPYTNWIGSLGMADREITRSAIETVGLDSLAHKKCYELSDGQLQKVMIARALAQDTPVVLLDEPTTHLDIYHKIQILKLLGQIAHEKGKTILFTTHEIDMAIQLCDKMLLLDAVENPFGHPCSLIEEQRFDKLFPADLVKFDPATGTFRVQK